MCGPDGTSVPVRSIRKFELTKFELADKEIRLRFSKLHVPLPSVPIGFFLFLVLLYHFR